MCLFASVSGRFSSFSIRFPPLFYLLALLSACCPLRFIIFTSTWLYLSYSSSRSIPVLSYSLSSFLHLPLLIPPFPRQSCGYKAKCLQTPCFPTKRDNAICVKFAFTQHVFSSLNFWPNCHFTPLKTPQHAAHHTLHVKVFTEHVFEQSRPRAIGKMPSCKGGQISGHEFRIPHQHMVK